MPNVIGGDLSCPIANSLAVLGDRWTLLIMRNALLGSSRFSEFHDALGIPRDILTARLAALVEGGALARESYKAAGERARERYIVTPAGHELLVILSALAEWGARNCAIDGTTSTRFVDAVSGEVVSARLVTADGRVVETAEVVATER